MRVRHLWLTLSLALVAPVTAQAKSFHLTQNLIDAQVRADGSMHVRETIGFAFSGSFHHASRRLPLRYGTSLSDVSVSEGGRQYAYGTGEAPGTYRASTEPGGVRIDWYYQAQDETRTFVIDYDITGAVIKHADVAELYWKFVGADTEVSTDSALVRVQLPGAVPADQVKVWGHGPLWGRATPVDGGATLEVRSVPPRTMIEARVVFPTEVIASSPREDEQNALAGILGKEGRWARQANKERLVARATVGGPIVLLVGGLLLWVLLYVRYGREYHEPIPPPEYVREPLEGWTPVQVGLLWRWGSISTTDMTATVMDLVRRGALKMVVQQEYEPRLGGLLGDKLQEECYLEWVKGYQGAVSDAEDYLIREVMFLSSAPGDRVSMTEISEMAKANPSESRQRFLLWRRLATKEAERYPVVDPASTSAMSWAIVVGALTVGAAYLLGKTGIGRPNSPLVLATCALGVAMAAGSPLIRRRNPEAAKALHRWQAFRRYLTDFSELSQYPAPAVELWDHYLVFAITLGVADRVVEQFKAIYPRLPQTDHGAPIFHNWVGTDGQPFSLSGFDAVGHAFSSFGQAMSIATSSFTSTSGGGGGFSGGGGGGGGGGGVSAD